MIMNLTGADVWTPRAAADLLHGLAATYSDMASNAEQFRNNQLADGVSGPPIEFLASIHDNYSIASAALSIAAERADRMCTLIGDTVGSSDSLAGTQAGGAADPAQL